MKKRCAIIIVGLLLGDLSPLLAQWTSGSNNTLYYNQGNVGIGTTASDHKLDVEGTTRAEELHLQVTGKNRILNLNEACIGFNRRVKDGYIYDKSKPAWQFTAVYDDKFLLEGFNGVPYKLMCFLTNGNMGIGTTTPQHKLDVEGTTRAEELHLQVTGKSRILNLNEACIGFNRRVKDGYIYDKSKPAWQFTAVYDDKFLLEGFNGVPYQLMCFLTNGNVGIGTTTPDHKLDVVGSIRAHEVLVNTAKGADFVFEPDYELLPLDSVASYVQQHRHLPDIAPADSMVQHGVEIGDMQVKLLQKIEELTLYVIEQEKRAVEQERRIVELESKLR